MINVYSLIVQIINICALFKFNAGFFVMKILHDINGARLFKVLMLFVQGKKKLQIHNDL